MGRIVRGSPRKIKHLCVACSENEFDIVRLTSAALSMSRSSLVRLLILEKYNYLIKNLDLKVEVENG